MTAYELADELKECIDDGFTDLVCVCDAANMLRQQADRIAELSKNVDELEEELLKAIHPNSEPVAWMLTLLDGTHDWILDGKGCEGYIPLYTAPQIKELSDEEILQQAEWMFGTHFFEMIDDPYWIEFAKAILKKASEK